MAKKVIITGINGFVGEHVADAFAAAGFDAVGLGHDSVASKKVSQKLHSYFQCNLLDDGDIAKLDLSGVAAIIHLAGLSNVGESFTRPLAYINDNSVMTFNILELARQQGYKGRIVVVSSGALYDPLQALPLSETSKSLENSPYAVGKLGVEHVTNYFRLRGLDAVAVRPFNHIGPGQGRGFLVPDLYLQLKDARNAGSTTISVGNLSTRRDYTDVRDIARAYRLIATAEKLDHGLYNICTGRSLSGFEILDKLQRLMGIKDVTPIVDQSKVRPTDIADIYGDSSRLREDLAWTPEIDIHQTISDFVERAKTEG